MTIGLGRAEAGDSIEVGIDTLDSASDRRVAEWGFWRANLTYLYVGLMWGFGAKSDQLSQHYEDVR